MKLNTSLFICLFFSAIIAIKAAGDFDSEGDDFSSLGSMIDKSPILSMESSEEEEQEVREEDQKPKATDFQYKPSERLKEMENNMPDSDQAFVEDGKVKKTLTDAYTSVMATDVARTGLSNVNHEWQLILDGPEASRVFGTLGQNFNTIATSSDGADMINMLATTAHVLLAKAGSEKMSSGLSDLMSLTYSLFTSSNMPEIVNMAGGLIITAVNKPKAPLFAKTFWDETQKLLGEKNLNEKLNKYFTNIMSMMKSMDRIMERAKQSRRKRSTTW